ncbi:MAG: S9 family peptidase, partial [Chitinophagaceae bacterium]
YGVSTVDSVKDKRNRDLYMLNIYTKEIVQLTHSPEGESSAKWSPDGKFISFVASRGDDYAQIWLLDRRGGEAKKLTNLKVEMEEYVWSPDGSTIAFVLKDPDYSDTAKSKTRSPYVIDRYQFKADVEGYLDNRKTHLYLYHVNTHKLDTLTSGNYNERQPVFSPDGSKIAFVSNRTEDPDKNDNDDIWLMDAKPGAVAKQLTTWLGRDYAPQFSPDGTKIAYLQSSSQSAFTMFGQNIAATVNIATGVSQLHTITLDRPVSSLIWANNNSLFGVVENDRQQSIYQFNLTDNSYQVYAGGDSVYSSVDYHAASGKMIAMVSHPYHPAEIHEIKQQKAIALTSYNKNLVATLQFAKVSGFTSVSKDGTKVSSILYTPNNAEAGKPLPLILWIHGGPVAQDDYDFDIISHSLAAQGFLVANVNYRGSNGRGDAYCKAIYSNWGNKEVMDIVGAANHLVKMGIADEQRMGIGGWSYGGILTNYTIATDTRFKAAASGAGSSLQFSIYGTDQYIVQYETELGAPWVNPKKWMEVSYPFFNVPKIKTPTLFMASEKDFNVPVAGAEQMYQAFKSVGIPTQLVIYPGQYHGISKPSYQKDRIERYIKWFSQYLK